MEQKTTKKEGLSGNFKQATNLAHMVIRRIAFLLSNWECLEYLRVLRAMKDEKEEETSRGLAFCTLTWNLRRGPRESIESFSALEGKKRREY